MKDKIAIVGSGLRPTTVAALAQRLIEKDIVKLEELKEDNDVYMIKNPYKDNTFTNPMLPPEKIRTKPCNRHEYIEKKGEVKDGIQFNKWVCRHCNKTLK